MSKNTTPNKYTKLLYFFLLLFITLVIIDIVLDFTYSNITVFVIVDSLLLLSFSALILILLNIKTQYKQIIIPDKNKLIAAQQNEIKNLNKMVSEFKNLYKDSADIDRQKTEYFVNLSHELKTPISVILGAIQLIEQSKANIIDRRQSSKQLQTIRQNSYRLLRLVNNILDLSKIDFGNIKTNMEYCNIVYLIEEICQSIISFAEQKGLLIEFDTESEEIYTEVDVEKIERIILNLLSNAIKFTPQGGKISVFVYNTSDKVYISIKDTGVGIPPNMQSKIFERFQQVDSPLTKKVDGSGIGLSLVKSFVALHGGTVAVKSELNKGSEFILEFPITQCDDATKNGITKDSSQNKIIEAINIEFSDLHYVTAS